MNTASILPKRIVIRYEGDDDLLHLPPYYFCNQPGCPCHNDPTLAAVLQAMIDAEEVTPARALAIYWNQ